jgi:hypothetical protein
MTINKSEPFNFGAFWSSQNSLDIYRQTTHITYDSQNERTKKKKHRKKGKNTFADVYVFSIFFLTKKNTEKRDRKVKL